MYKDEYAHICNTCGRIVEYDALMCHGVAITEEKRTRYSCPKILIGKTLDQLGELIKE